MADKDEQIQLLLNKLDDLMKRQEYFSKEIQALRVEITQLRTKTNANPPIKGESVSNSSYTGEQNSGQKEKILADAGSISTAPAQKLSSTLKGKSNLEKFIGENLINKIGIIITVIGAGIGAKYSIEHELISPLTRIMLGYLMGSGLLGFGIKLKKKYPNYSAVLVGGAIAIFYFITFSAYNFYSLIPQTLAFALMVVFTIFAVVAALHYDMQVIAHIGLVGAYAVPFLLSDGSGKVAILFSYTAIINGGILFIAFKKYWKPLYYVAFILTWLIYTGWYVFSYKADVHFFLAFTFLIIFFFTFYALFLSYKLVKKEKFEKQDIFFLLSNSFIFYGYGYTMLNGTETGKYLLGIFTLCNAIIHFIISAVIYRQKLADKNLFFMIAGLVLVFITITIPVQLEGNWVTMLWAGEAALLFWIGRTKNVATYERLAYPLILLMVFSLVQDLVSAENVFNHKSIYFTPVFNIRFLTALIVIASLSWITFLNSGSKYDSTGVQNKKLKAIVNYGVPTLLLVIIYFVLRVEISIYFNQLYLGSMLEIKDSKLSIIDTYIDNDWREYQSIWILNYSLLFFSILSFINFKKIKNKLLGIINLGLNTLTIFIFLIQGLYLLSELRESYLTQEFSKYYTPTAMNIGIRYVCFAFVSLAFVCIHRYRQQEFMQPLPLHFKMLFELFLHSSMVWITSSELLSWMDIFHSSHSYKLGLSILWGIYALFLIILGIWKKRQFLRICAIVLFTVTLVKLFFYDIDHLNTIAKTIVFVTLGILLLAISFLYNKYKHLINAEHEN